MQKVYNNSRLTVGGKEKSIMDAYDYSSTILGGSMIVSGIVWLITIAVSVLVIIAQWKLFVKAGRHGWAALIPFYNTYTMFDIVYGNGISFLKLLIPFYNIYVMIKFYLDFAVCYGQSAAYGIGLWLLSPVFFPLLAFSSDTAYRGPVVR